MNENKLSRFGATRHILSQFTVYLICDNYFAFSGWCQPDYIKVTLWCTSYSHLIESPIRVAMLQCGMVGVNSTPTLFFPSSTRTSLNLTTSNCSRVRGCSGSLMPRIKSKICNIQAISLKRTIRM